MALALEGIKVVDVSQVAAVPMATQHLADFGAGVIHVEHPVRGDYMRELQFAFSNPVPAVASDINYVWENYNRNKRDITLDLTQEDGQKVVRTLAEKADVFVSNLRPFELERYDLEYDNLSRLNPKLIYGNLTGYGRKGPDKDGPAYDNVAHWARGGVAYRMTPPTMRPTNGVGAFGDNVGGMALFAGVMTALYVRERTGIGQEIDISLYQIAFHQLALEISGTLIHGRDFPEEALLMLKDAGEGAVNPLAITYKTRDERWFLLHILQQDRYWSRFCKAIGREDLEHDPRFESFEPRRENRVALFHILEEVFLGKTMDEWKSRLAGIPAAPVQNYREIVADPQARANDFCVPFEHPTHGRIEVMANPIKLSKTPATIRTPAPEFGEHTEEVLLEYGYTWEDIARFKEQHVIA